MKPVNGSAELTEEIPDTESSVEAETVHNEETSETAKPDVDMIIPKQEPGRPSLYTEPPAYLEIIMHAMKRSAGSEEEAICFTEEEMRQLLADPEFCRMEKDLTQAFRYYLGRMEDG